ncbi:MAG: carboxypeptidase-like regulatory domain-containing protein, partial [Bacteroidota bacterium]
MNRYIYLLLLFCGYTNLVTAQFTLSGIVTDNSEQDKIPKVEIFNLTTGDFTTADETGFFQFKQLQSGEYELAFFSYEYETITKTVNLTKDTQLTVALNPLQIELSEVVVAAKREELFALKRLRPVEGTAIYAGKKSE